MNYKLLFCLLFPFRKQEVACCACLPSFDILLLKVPWDSSVSLVIGLPFFRHGWRLRSTKSSSFCRSNICLLKMEVPSLVLFDFCPLSTESFDVGKLPLKVPKMLLSLHWGIWGSHYMSKDSREVFTLAYLIVVQYLISVQGWNDPKWPSHFWDFSDNKTDISIGYCF